MTQNSDTKTKHVPTAVVFNIALDGKSEQVIALRHKFSGFVKKVRHVESTPNVPTGPVHKFQYSGARNFYRFLWYLQGEGLHLNDCYINPAGKIVFTIGDIPSDFAESVFLAIADHTGWSVLEFKNPDGSIVYAAANGHVLADEVAVKGPKGTDPVSKPRDWSAIQVWPYRR